LAGISVFFVVLERLWPWRHGQALLRPGWVRDLGFLAINGHFFSLLTAGLSGWTALQATGLLQRAGLRFDASPVPRWPFWAQAAVFLLVSDFLQWSVHNLLHRVSWLWTFHKVHHAITSMDFVGNFRFHWVEILVYKSVQWLPLALLGASGEAAFVVAVLGTFWGDLNHANLNVSLGPLGYVFNNPRMHLWHHDASDEGGVAKNFGIVLSLWDFLFHTAYWPRDRSPLRLGYPGVEEMPPGLLGELAWPLAGRR
jgi:sterol desaturase/sphingolipid hydroxylase (fatty acid hydroxylase superfamily)